MKVEEWGYTNPVVSYLYGKPPLVWRDMRVQLVVYETDIENVRRVVPEPMQPRTNIVITWVSEFELGTTQGGFKEAAIYVQVKYGDIEGDYEPFLYVNSHLPLTAGREIWGYQKKLADIGLHLEYEAVRGQVNRFAGRVAQGGQAFRSALHVWLQPDRKRKRPVSRMRPAGRREYGDKMIFPSVPRCLCGSLLSES